MLFGNTSHWRTLPLQAPILPFLFFFLMHTAPPYHPETLQQSVLPPDSDAPQSILVASGGQGAWLLESGSTRLESPICCFSYRGHGLLHPLLLSVSHGEMAWSHDRFDPLGQTRPSLVNLPDNRPGESWTFWQEHQKGLRSSARPVSHLVSSGVGCKSDHSSRCLAALFHWDYFHPILCLQVNLLNSVTVLRWEWESVSGPLVLQEMLRVFCLLVLALLVAISQLALVLCGKCGRWCPHPNIEHGLLVDCPP